MLKDVECRALTCPPDKWRVRLTDAKGLYLEAMSSGSKRWFYKFRFAGVEKRMALGTYPEVSLKDAREKLEDARTLVGKGINPIVSRQIDKHEKATAQLDTFEAIAREYAATKKNTWVEGTRTNWFQLMEGSVFPEIGGLPIGQIKASTLLACVRKIEGRGHNAYAHRAMQNIGQVFQFAVITERCERNLAHGLSKGLEAYEGGRNAAVVNAKAVGKLMRDFENVDDVLVRTLLKFSAYVFQRPANVRSIQWAHIDFEKALWKIPAGIMKRRKADKQIGRDHFVPLASQVLQLLEEMKPLSGKQIHVFPSSRTGTKHGHISYNVIPYHLARLGYGRDVMTAHGFRAMARTVIAEDFEDIDSEVIEVQLAHGKRGPLKDAYDRASYMAKRQSAMQRWADHLDRLREGAQIIALPQQKAA